MTDAEMRTFVAEQLDLAADAIWRACREQNFDTEQVVKMIAGNMLDLAIVDLVELAMSEEEFMKLCRRRFQAARARRRQEGH
jgi:hypothetical protein